MNREYNKNYEREKGGGEGDPVALSALCNIHVFALVNHYEFMSNIYRYLIFLNLILHPLFPNSVELQDTF